MSEQARLCGSPDNPPEWMTDALDEAGVPLSELEAGRRIDAVPEGQDGSVSWYQQTAKRLDGIEQAQAELLLIVRELGKKVEAQDAVIGELNAGSVANLAAKVNGLVQSNNEGFRKLEKLGERVLVLEEVGAKERIKNQWKPKSSEPDWRDSLLAKLWDVVTDSNEVRRDGAVVLLAGWVNLTVEEWQGFQRVAPSKEAAPTTEDVQKAMIRDLARMGKRLSALEEKFE
jgi:hypothetical protein